MSKPLIISHGPHCTDGFASSWSAWRKFGDQAEYMSANYGDAPPRGEAVAGRDVYILDFSYPRDVLLAMSRMANRVVVLDHHASAQKDLGDLTAPNLMILFRMDISGARMAWEYFHPETTPPWLIDFVEDRDLWRHKLLNSKEVSAAIASYPFEFELWNKWHGYGNGILGSEQDKHAGALSWMDVLAQEGTAILRYQRQQVEKQIANASEREIGGHKVLAVCATHLISEIAGALAVGRPFGATFFVDQQGREVWSLRSSEDGIDVSEVAKKLGGGGHKHSAEFFIDRS